MHKDTLERRKQELLMRSARERVEFLDSLDAARRDASAGVGGALASSKRAVKRVGVVSAYAAGAVVGVRLLLAMLFRRRRSVSGAIVRGGLRLAFSRLFIKLLILPLAKHYMMHRVYQAILPASGPLLPLLRGPKKEPGEGVRVKVRNLPWLARLSPRRLVARWLGV